MDPLVYEIDHLLHTYGKDPVLCIDEFKIRESSILGLAGPNGSGKTTLLKLLSFVEKPSRGVIRFQGKPAAPFDPAVRFQTALLPQEPYLLKRTVFQNIAYGLKIRRDVDDLKKRVHDALERVGLPSKDFAGRRWMALSGGEAQRVALAARMVLRPKVLLLDEPTANVDAESMIRIRDAALDSRDAWGATVIIASHDRSWLAGVSDDIAYLFKGRISSSSMENMIFGPWIQVLKGQWGKRLPDGQALIFSTPPTPDAIAVIDPERLRISTETDDNAQADVASLCGRIERLALDNSGGIAVTAFVAGLSLTASVPADTVCRVSLHPGQPVALRYETRHVRWIQP